MRKVPQKLPTMCLRCKDNTLYCAELRPWNELGSVMLDVHALDPLMCAKMICIHCMGEQWAPYALRSVASQYTSPVKTFEKPKWT